MDRDGVDSLIKQQTQNTKGDFAVDVLQPWPWTLLRVMWTDSLVYRPELIIPGFSNIWIASLFPELMLERLKRFCFRRVPHGTGQNGFHDIPTAPCQFIQVAFRDWQIMGCIQHDQLHGAVVQFDYGLLIDLKVFSGVTGKPLHEMPMQPACLAILKTKRAVELLS